VMVIGMAAISVNVIIYAVMGSSAGLDVILPALVIGGIGTGLAFNGSNIGAIQASPPERAGMASGVVSEVRLLGNVFGVAIPLALFDAITTAKLNSLQATVPASQLQQVRSLLSGSSTAHSQLAQLPAATAHDIESAVRTVFAAGLRGSMALVAAAALVAVPLVLRSPRPKPARELAGVVAAPVAGDDQ
jgi:hypothetical protein